MLLTNGSLMGSLLFDPPGTEHAEHCPARVTDRSGPDATKYRQKGPIWIPRDMKVGSWIVTGTPGSGKSYLMEQIGAIPGEVCIDIARKKWWKVPPLAQRPREVHFALPFKGHKESYPVYDDIWTRAEKLPVLDLKRIRIPKRKKFVLAPDWQGRFVFDFILPPPDWVYEARRLRFARGDTKLVDIGITNRLVTWQVRTLWRVAAHFEASGLQVLMRPFNLAYPYAFPELRRAAHKKSKFGSASVFPKGVDMGLEMKVRDWIARTAPKDWVKAATRKGKGK